MWASRGPGYRGPWKVLAEAVGAVKQQLYCCEVRSEGVVTLVH